MITKMLNNAIWLRFVVIGLATITLSFAGLFGSETWAWPSWLGGSSTPQTQTTTGGAASPSAVHPTDSSGTTDIHPEDYVENFSAWVRQEIREKRLVAPDGRDSESRQIQIGLQGEGATETATVVTIGDPKIGKTSAWIQYVLDNPDEVVYRVLTEKLGEIKGFGGNPAFAKGAQVAALKTILDFMAKKDRTPFHRRPITYIENLDALMAGGPGEVKLGSAVINAVSDKATLRLGLEMSASTLKDIKEASKTFEKRSSVVELGPPVQDTIIKYLRTNRDLIERTYRVSLSEPAIAEATRQALRYDQTDAFRGAFVILSTAARLLARDKQEGTNEVIRLTRQLVGLDLEIKSLQSDFQISPQTVDKDYLSALREKRNELSAKLDAVAGADPSTMAQVADLDTEIVSLTAELSRIPENDRKRAPLREAKASMIAERKAKKLQLLTLLTEATNLEGKPSDQVGPKHVQMATSDIKKVDLATVSMDVKEGLRRIGEINDELFGLEHLVARAQQRISAYFRRVDRAQALAAITPGAEQPRKKPIWTVLIPGRTGTGKSDFAIKLASKLGVPLVTIHMSSYTAAHHASGLIGARPEYTGFGQDGELTGPVRRTPYAVIMLDEVQRAHIDVIKTIVYPIFDQGFIKDGEGRTIYFDQAIFVMPTNAGEAFSAMRKPELEKYLRDNPDQHILTEDDLQAMDELALRSEAVKISMRTDFGWEESMMSRIQDVLPTNDWTDPNIWKKVRKEVLNKNRELTQDGVHLKLTKPAMEALRKSFKPNEGGRSIESFFTRNFGDPIDSRLGTGEIAEGQTFIVDYDPATTRFDYIVTSPEKIAAIEHHLKGTTKLNTTEGLGEALAHKGSETPVEELNIFDPAYIIHRTVVEAMRRMGKE